MVKRYTKRFCYWVCLTAAWGLLAYSVLFSGFSTTLADYYQQGNGLWCYQLRGCTGQAGCTNGGSVNGCTIYCTGGSGAICPTKP